MGLGTYPVKGQPAGLVAVLVRLRGAGAAAPLVECGPNGEVPDASASATSGVTGLTTTRAAAGDYTLTFKEKPGKFMCVTPGYGVGTPSATTPRFVQAEEDAAFEGTAQTIRMFHVTPATDAAAAAASDMAATDVLYLIFWFRTIAANPPT